MLRRSAAAVVVALVPLALGCSDDGKPGSGQAGDNRPGSCAAVTPGVAVPQTFPEAPEAKVDAGKTYELVLETTCGTIRANLLASEAPATVSSMAFLAGKQYFDGSFCHRATQTAMLTAIQCGDPTGTGAGGPGYTIPEENLPTPSAGGYATYPRGTLAMARTTEPHSTGSQFFMVAKESTLPADYTVFATVTSGVEVLDTMLAQGIDDRDGDTSSGLDGALKRKVYLTTVRVTETKT